MNSKLALFLVLILGFVASKQVFLGTKEQEKQDSFISVKLNKVTYESDDHQKVMELITEAQQYARNREPTTEFVETNYSKEQGKSLKLYNFQNEQYLGEIALTEESNTFKVIFDTGSGNTWVNSNRCSDPGCLNHKQYDHNQSLNYEDIGLNMDVHFGTGELQGTLAQDTVFLAGISIPNQQFSEIVSEDGGIFEDSKFDGIVGMSYPSMAAYDVDPIFDSLMKQNKIEKNIFSFYMNNKAESSTSQLTIGGVDKSLYEGDINYHKITNKSFWEFKAQNILVGGKDIGLCKDGCNLIADTGTSLITAPSQFMDTLYDNVPVEDSCVNLKDLPDLTFVVDDHEYVMKSDDYVVGDEISSSANTFDNQERSEMLEMGDFEMLEGQKTQMRNCYLGVMPLDLPVEHGNSWILGNTFLRNYYSVYDRDNNQVGFANAKKR